MSIFGKILAIFNVFAVAGVVALMAMNYARRLSWEYAVFRQDLMINGLPLDDAATDEMQQPIAAKTGTKTQQDLFKQAVPPEPVATQEAEVQRVKGQLDDMIRNAGDKLKQIVALARILTPMADTIEQRQRLLAYQLHLRDDKMFSALKERLRAAHKAATSPVEGQAKPYEQRFHDVLAATFGDLPGPLAEEFLAVMKPNQKADFDKTLEQSLDNQLAQLQGQYDQMFRNTSASAEGGKAAQRKQAIARFLFNMLEVLPPTVGSNQTQPDLVSNPAYKRFVIVVGVKAAVAAVNEQASILKSLVTETAVERQRERNLFVVQQRKAVDLVRDKKSAVDHHTLSLARKNDEQKKHLATLNNRKQDVQYYEEQLAAARRDTSRRLQQLHKLSDQLFAERVQLRDRTQAIQQLEKDIRALEEGH